MTEFKGTPGPWRVNGSWVEHANGDVCTIRANTGTDEHRFNGRLIAAAPELLEALQEAHAVTLMLTAPESIRSTSTMDAWARCVALEVKARAAKAKASAVAADVKALAVTAKALVESLPAERLAVLAGKSGLTVTQARKKLRSMAHWSPAFVIRSLEA